MSQYKRVNSFVQELQRQQANMRDASPADREVLSVQRELIDELNALLAANGGKGWITKDDYIAIIVLCLLGIILLLLVLLIQVVDAAGIDAVAVIMQFLAAN